MFDDGSRIILQDESAVEGTSSPPSSTNVGGDGCVSGGASERGDVPIEVYYEIERVANEAVDKLDWSENCCRGRLLRKLLDAANGIADDVDTSAALEEDDGFLCRIALQFPDELLSDASQVTWLMEDAILNAYKAKLTVEPSHPSPQQQELQQQITTHLSFPPLLYILGDTTYGSCCPDTVSAKHLNANVLIHYGYACLSDLESGGISVVYSFGVVMPAGSKEKGSVWKKCVDLLLQQMNADKDVTNDGEKNLEVAAEELTLEETKKKLLVLYEVKYHHAMWQLKKELEETDQIFLVLGMIPEQQHVVLDSRLPSSSGGCGSGGWGQSINGCDNTNSASTVGANTCCGGASNKTKEQTTGQEATVTGCYEPSVGDCCNNASPDTNIQSTAIQATSLTKQYIPRTIGGLEIPDDLDLSQYTLLYIGDDLNIDSTNNNNAHTRLLHILLRCNAPDGTQSLWSYSPLLHCLNTDILNSSLSPSNPTTLSTFLSRTLRRRYFLIQKAKLATTIGILIGTTSNSYSFRCLLSRTRRRIQATGRTAYTFAVGKLSSSASKVTNFAEIETFVLIACGESIAKFWRMEREEMLVPVITPMELDVALGLREWDGRYSCDYGDLIRWDREDGIEEDEEDGTGLVNSIDGGGKKKALDDDNSGSEGDEPFFSVISGKYEHSRAPSSNPNNNSDLEALPGKGQLMEYRSEAAEFLKSREYKGLEANVGQTEVKAAVLGMVGIASDYGEKLKKAEEEDI
jgi:diphthamide biosynthesis protein 2